MKRPIILSMLIAIMALTAFQSCKKDRTTVYVNTGNSNTGGNSTPTKFPINVLGSFAKQKPAPNKKTFDINNGTVFYTASGSSFTINPNSLVHLDNSAVTGNVELEIIEYRTPADMLFSGVTVTSGNQLLESGGMFYIMARQNGQELKLKNGSTISMKIAQTNNNDEIMNFWNGEENMKDSLNIINWVEAKDTVAVVPKPDSGNHVKYYNLNFNYFEFGYCNIDREMSKFKNKIKKFRIKCNDSFNKSNSTALLLFKQYNSCAWCYWADDKEMSTYYELPLNETIKVLVYRKTGPGEDDLEYAIREYTLLDESLVEFDVVTKCTYAELSAIIKAL